MTLQFTEKQSIAMQTLQSEKYNLILYGGSIRGGKSVWGLSALLILCEIFPKSRWCVIRENIERIRTTTIPSFSKLEYSGNLRQTPYEYNHPNGSVILFKGENYAVDKDLDWMKGLEVNGFLFEEINECQKQTLYKAFERAGAWVIPNNGLQPKPIILATCNPTFGWLKELIYDKWKNDTLPETWCYIPAKITDNPHLPASYIESLKNLPRFEYEVFVEGNWDIQLKTGGEFLKAFELEKHVKYVNPNFNEIIHLSIDSNVSPYIAVTAWQLKKDNSIWQVKQVHEMPFKDPYNTAKRAGEEVGKWLTYNNYIHKRVFVYGDRSTKSRNNIDDDKRSFYEIFTQNIKKAGYEIEDKMCNHAPPVAAIGDFVNAILDGSLKFAEISISESCKESINDYIETKQDKDGTILKKRITDSKTGISYEPHGHITDNFKDFISQVFKTEFDQYTKRGTNMSSLGITQVKRNMYKLG